MNIRSSTGRAIVQRLFGSNRVEGQALVEYSLLILLLVIAVVGAFTTMADTINEKFWQVIAVMP